MIFFPKSFFYRNKKILEAIIISFILIIAAFPDVIFLSASFRQTDQIIGNQNGEPLKAFYEIPNSTGWWAGYNDSGGAVFQSEPMIEFMKYCFKTKQSPYWNPYSAAGSLGPETLVDQKFSFFTILNAILDGNSLTYNVIMLILLYFSVFFMYRVSREYLNLGILACTGVSVFYLLNGYSIANLASNVTQTYLYIPMCIYTSLNFFRSPRTLSFLFIIASFVVFFSCTFFPTTLTALSAIYIVLLSYIYMGVQQNETNYLKVLKYFCFQIIALLIAFFVLAILYLPLIENLQSTGTLENYTQRVFYGLKFPQALASLFSSTHLFELYNAMEPAAIFWSADNDPSCTSVNGNTVYHMGIIAIIFIGSCYSIRKTENKFFATISLLFIGLIFIRLFKSPVSIFFSQIPIIGNLGCQYWWPALMVPLAFLIGIGIQNIKSKNFKLINSVVLLILGALLILYVYKIYGFHEPHIKFKRKAITLLGYLSIFVLIILYVLKINKREVFSTILLSSMVVGMFAELMVHSKMVRFGRHDFYLTPPKALDYVRNNIGLFRSMNIGSEGLYPELGSAFQIQEITSMNQGVFPAYKKYFIEAIDPVIEEGVIPDYKLYHTVEFPTLRMLQDEPFKYRFNWKNLNFLGLKYIILPANYIKYCEFFIKQGLRIAYKTVHTIILENFQVLPRAFAVNKCSAENLITLPEDLKNIQKVDIDVYENTKVRLSGYVNRDGLVVLSDNWHPNWCAEVNGIETPIVKVNGVFRGVFVKEGDFVIKMKYQIKSLSLAILLSIGTLCMLVIMFFCRKRLNRIFNFHMS